MANEIKTIESAARVLGNLYGRWQDEQEYEDFEEYKVVMAGALPEGATLTKMTKRPFEVVFTLADGTRQWLRANAREVLGGGFR